MSKAALFCVLLAAVSCSKKQTSSVTGWTYNDPKTGGFQVARNVKQVAPPGMVYIEGGTFTMGRTYEDIPSDWNNVPRRVTVVSFYMDQCEISNLNWNEYLHWTKLVLHNYPDLIRRATPDTLVWRSELAYNEPYVDYYFTHVAYNNYPVVGVSWEQANDYCVWRTDRLNEMVMYKNKIINLPDYESIKTNDDAEDIKNNLVYNTDKYLQSSEYNPEDGKKPMTDAFGEQRKVSSRDGILYLDIRLPIESEWEYAAYGISAKDKEENFGEKQQFPWAGHQMRNPNKKFRGEMMANYVRGRGDMMGLGGHLNDKAAITNTVTSYWPNGYGLYNMAGNVNEWVMDVYRPLSSEQYEEYNAFRGNEYKSPLLLSSTMEGKQVKIPVIDSLGRVKYVYPVEKDSMDQYIKYDVRNFRDGDAKSSKASDNWKTPMDPDEAAKLMYDPDQATSAESMLAPKLTNTTRVYKGGSWKDRAYWLSPGTRRYMEQTKSASDVGFRCAMSKVGVEPAAERK